MTHRSRSKDKLPGNGGRIAIRVRKVLHRAGIGNEKLINDYVDGIYDSGTETTEAVLSDVEIVEDFNAFQQALDQATMGKALGPAPRAKKPVSAAVLTAAMILGERG